MAERNRIWSVSWGSIEAAVAAAAVLSESASPFVPPWLVASMLLRLWLGCCDDDVGQRNAYLGVLVATGLDGDVDELEQAVGLLLSQCNGDFHIRRQCRKRRAAPQPKPAPPAATSEERSSQAGAEEQAATTAAAER
jgi:hypothetical protein